MLKRHATAESPAESREWMMLAVITAQRSGKAESQAGSFFQRKVTRLALQGTKGASINLREVFRLYPTLKSRIVRLLSLPEVVGPQVGRTTGVT